jgi:hypothetical protein
MLILLRLPVLMDVRYETTCLPVRERGKARIKQDRVHT